MAIRSIFAALLLSLKSGYVAAQAFEPPQAAISQDERLLNVFEVTTPVKISNTADCTAKLMEYSFGFSYGKPFVGPYVPPACDFNRVALTFTVTSIGRQFDRLAVMYLNDTEIWRTSTAEPNAEGIIWTYTKDVSNYLSLWKQPAKVIFDLGNLVDDRYTGRFNTTLTATFFKTNVTAPPADVILPISKARSAEDQSSAFSIPQDPKALKSLTLPRNAKRAIFSVSACGQAQEEFWWSNVPSSKTLTFGNETSLLGFSPWREVQVLIDDKLAGVAWPYPVIFTGGVVPAFWRPVVGVDTFDLREDEIDVTPWLPVLSDGKEHTFEIRVVGLDDDGKESVTMSPVGASWIVTGKVFLWLDQPGAITTGDVPKINASDPKFQLQQNLVAGPDGKNASLTYSVTAARTLIIQGNIVTSDGPRAVSWNQTRTFFNNGTVEGEGNKQYNNQMTTGVDMSSRNYTKRIRYPLMMDSRGTIDEVSREINIRGKFSRGKTVLIIGEPTQPSGLENYADQLEPNIKGCLVNNTQRGEANIVSAKNVTKSSALTEQSFTFSTMTGDVDIALYDMGEPALMYSRRVLARNDKLTNDEEITREASPVDVPLRVKPDVTTAVPQQILDTPGPVELLTGRKYAYLLNKNPPTRLKAMPVPVQRVIALPKRSRT